MYNLFVTIFAWTNQTKSNQTRLSFYQAPEILQGHKYGAKADLWSVGAILYEMLAGKPPFGGQNQVRRCFEILLYDRIVYIYVCMYI